MSAQEQLTAWLTEEMRGNALEAVRSSSEPTPRAIERTASALLEHLSGIEAAQALVLSRISDIACRGYAGRPSDRDTLLRWLRKDAADPQHRALAEAAIQPAAQLPVVAVIPQAQPRRERFRAPQFGEQYEALAQAKALAAAQAQAAQAAPAPAPMPAAPIQAPAPAEPTPSALSAQERAELRGQLESELSMPERYRNADAIAYLVHALGDEGRRMVSAADGEDAQPTSQATKAKSAEVIAEVPQVLPRQVPPLQPEPETPRPSPVEPARAVEPPRAPEAKPSASPYAPFPFAQLSQELGYKPQPTRAPTASTDLNALWPGLVEAVRAGGRFGQSYAALYEATTERCLDTERRTLRLSADDETAARLSSFDAMAYRVAILERLELRTALSGWRIEITASAQGRATKGER